MADAAAQPATEAPARHWGLLAEFEDVPAIYDAAGKVKDAGYKRFDVYAPFPVHGLDHKMGLGTSKVAFITATGAIVGVGGALLLQWWTSAVDYALIVAGKPFWAWEQFMPITFELGVLIAGVSTIVGMLAMNGLPRFNHPLFSSDRFLRASDDRFFIAIEARDPKYDREAVEAFLREAGAVAVEEVDE